MAEQYVVKIEVEDDKTCSVTAPHMMAFYPACVGKIKGLSPEQATNLKLHLEGAFHYGWDRGLQTAQQSITKIRERIEG